MFMVEGLEVSMKSYVILLVAFIFSGCVNFPVCRAEDSPGEILLREDFSDGDMTGWWVEGGEKVWVQEGALHVKADPSKMNKPAGVCTVWYNRKFQGDIEILFDAHVIESAANANNINFFFCYTHPEEGKTIWSTREERADSDYVKYHNLNGYIVTFLNDFNKESPVYDDGTSKARLRMRRCPGFKLINETFDYHCRAGVTYHCKIVKKGGHIEFHVDGKKFLEADDEDPWNEGLIGLRTFRTHLWWDNIVVRRI